MRISGKVSSIKRFQTGSRKFCAKKSCKNAKDWTSMSCSPWSTFLRLLRKLAIAKVISVLRHFASYTNRNLRSKKYSTGEKTRDSLHSAPGLKSLLISSAIWDKWLSKSWPTLLIMKCKAYWTKATKPFTQRVSNKWTFATLACFRRFGGLLSQLSTWSRFVTLWFARRQAGTSWSI